MKDRELRKTLLMGLSNSGKSSILQYLVGVRNLPAFSINKPTIQINRVFFQAVEYDQTIWDFGGQECLINEYLEKFDSFLIGADTILFVIDIQDENKFEPSINYLNKIIKYLGTNHSISFKIYLHKFDPDLNLTYPNITSDKIEHLIQKITNIFPKKFKYKISKTSIYAKFKEVDVKS